uniref:Uncharacterized protein n=1 Tax=Parascaris univalens TaxID=6257 RepID=A0A915A9K1_PARUN
MFLFIGNSYDAMMLNVVFVALMFMMSEGSQQSNLSVRTIKKRQVLYYICDTYPSQYFSYNPCIYYNNPSPINCANAMQQVGVSCSYDYQCAIYSSQASRCISGCCQSVAVIPVVPSIPSIASSTQSAVSLGYCYDGQRSQARCTAQGQCLTGQTCINNICCTTTDKQYLHACGGIAALGSCTRSGTCPNAFVCTASNYCCECTFGRTSGFCSQGCTAGYKCSANGYCCPSCPSGETPFGSCYNGMCAEGYSCRAGNICCRG